MVNNSVIYVLLMVLYNSWVSLCFCVSYSPLAFMYLSYLLLVMKKTSVIVDSLYDVNIYIKRKCVCLVVSNVSLVISF